jgi:hypothetical protein
LDQALARLLAELEKHIDLVADPTTLCNAYGQIKASLICHGH